MKKLQFFEKHNMLKRGVSWVLLLSLLISIVPGPVALAQAVAPVMNPDFTYGDLLSMGLAEVAGYGVVANTYEQNGHAETSVAVTNLIKNSTDAFMPTIDTLNDKGDLVVTPKVTVSGAHSAFTTKFALFMKSGTGYTAVTDPVTATFSAKSGSETITLPSMTVTDQSAKMAGLYLMEVDSNDDYILNGGTDDYDYTVQYGEGIAPLPIVSTQLQNYIGDIAVSSGADQINLKLMQGTSFAGQSVSFGPGIYLYEKVGNSYVKVDHNTTHSVSEFYIRDESWTNTSYPYKKFENVTYDGAGNFTYSGYPIQFNFDVKGSDGTTDYASSLVNKAIDLSKAMAGSAVVEAAKNGLPGGDISTSAISKNTNGEYWGNGTVASWEDLGGQYSYTTTTFYAATVSNGRVDLSSFGASSNKMALSDNEYAIINVVCPSKTGEVSTPWTLQLTKEDGTTVDNNGWRSGGSYDYSRVIWNYVYEAEDGSYQPFEGQINYDSTCPGLTFAPKAFVKVTCVADASAFVADKLTNIGVELHQTNHKPVGRATTALLNKGGLKVLKEDDNGDPVEGAVFGVYSDSSCTQLVYTFPATTVGADSEKPDVSAAVLDSVPIGTYYVKEISAPDGYTANDGVFSVTVASNDSYYYVNSGSPIVNEVDGPRGYIEITKRDSANSAALAGATLGIYRDSDCTEKAGEMGPTDSNGYAKSLGLPVGTYYVKEIVAPQGYKLSTTMYSAVVVADETVTVNGGYFYNDKAYGSMTVTKVDAAATTTLLSGAVFTVYSDADCTTEYATMTATNTSGVSTLSNVPVGTYYVKETKAPEGYAKNGAVFTVLVEENKTAVINNAPVENQKGKGSICLYKADANDPSNMLANAVYSIFSDPDCLDAHRVDQITTNANGYAESDLLPFGEYWVKEYHCPDGYELDTTVYHVEIRDDSAPTQVLGPGSVHNALLDDYTDYPVGSIKLYKCNEDYEPLGNATFYIYSDPECTTYAKNYEGKTLSSFLTSSSGYARVSNVPFGVYYIKENKAPKGYAKDLKVYKVVVDTSETTICVKGSDYNESGLQYPIINKEDEGTGYIWIYKKDKNTKAALAGAKFNIYSDPSCAPEYFVESMVSRESDGAAMSSYLPYGTYWVLEVAPPAGYAMDTDAREPVELTINSGTTKTGKTLYNVEGTFAEIYAKKNFVGKKDRATLFQFKLTPVDGAKMPVTGDTIEVLETQGAKSFGRIYYTQDDLDGAPSADFTYKVSEIIPTQGALEDVSYDENEYTVTVHLAKTIDGLKATVTSDLGTASSPVVITNRYDGGYIQVKKMDHNKTELLEGAKFSVFDNAECTGTPVTSMTTDATGTAMTYKALPSGTYYVKETSAPRGFNIDNADPVAVVVTPDHTEDAPCTLTFTDTELEGQAQFKVKKTATGIPDGTEFTFKLTPVDDAPTLTKDTITITGSGTGTFEAITFKGRDMGLEANKTFEYQITEIVPEDPVKGVVYDTEPRNVSVTLRIVNGKLRATPSTDTELPEIINTYETGSLMVTKKDAADSKNLSGAEFTIYSDASCTVVADTMSTNASGQAFSKDLPVGEYWIKETKAPHGYTIDDTTAHKASVTVDSTSQTLSYTYTDTEQEVEAVFKVKKVVSGIENNDSYTFVLDPLTANQPMPATGGDKVTVKPGQIGSFGTIKFKYSNIATGQNKQTFTYTITEEIPEEPVPGIVYDTKSHTVTVTLTMDGETLTATTSTDTNSLTITNTYEEAYLTVTKVDSENTGKKLAGAVFTVYDVNSVTVATLTTTYNGIAELEKGLAPGNYWIKETKAPEGYEIDDGDARAITLTSAHTSKNPYSTDLTFTDTEKKAQASFGVQKAISGNLDDKTTEFEFVLTPVDADNPMPATNKVTAKADGISVTFGEMSYTYSMLEGATSKDFTYWINEVEPAAEDKNPGITYDTVSKTVTVTLAWDKDNDTLTAVSSTEAAALTITNTYAAKGEITLEGTKILEGRDLTSSDVFTFTVKDKDSNTVATGASDATGKVTFTKIEYASLESVGEYIYTITEDDTNISGVTKDSTTKTVTVVVSDIGDGTLKTEIKIGSDDIKFTNTYEASGEITLTGTKTLEGRDLEDSDIFTFTVKEGNTVVATGTNEISTGKAGKTITFTTISYELNKEKDETGDHTYTITEDSTTIAGVSVDGSSKTVVVTVTDNGDGTLKAELKDTSDKIEFTNTYETGSTDVTLHVAKTVNGKTDSTATFTFTLAPVTTGAPVADPAEVTVKAGETGDFGKLTFEAEGTYEYTITEEDGKLKGYTYDTEAKTVTITVEDDGKGNLTAKVEGGTGFDANTNTQTITNTYEAEGEITLTGTKTLEGRDLEDSDIFTFTVKEGNTVVATGTNEISTGKAGKTITFTTISYELNKEKDDTGDHTYTITEDSTTIAGVSVDGSSKSVTVTVTDNGDGTLKAELTDTSDEIKFINTYETGSTDVTLHVAKTVNGKTDSTATFTFTLAPVTTGAPVADPAEVTVNAGETGDFGKLTFEAEGTYEYTITEEDGKLKGYTYDTEAKTVTITVEDDGKGNLSAKVEGGTGFDANTNTQTITNTYNSGKLGVTKTDATASKNPLANAVFTVYSDASCTVVEDTLTTTASGTAESKELTVGTYWIKETKAPEGYEIDDVVAHEFEVTANATSSTLSFTFTDTEKTAKASLDVKKVITGTLDDKTTEFEFVLTPADADNPMPVTNKVTAKADGISVTFGEMSYTYSMLEDGTSKTFTYWINEVEPAAEEKIPGLTYDTKSKTVTVTLTWDKDSDTLTAVPSTLTEPATVTNVYEDAYLKITKTDATESKNPLAGAVFTVYDDDSCTVTVATLTTTAVGTAELEIGLPVGTYWIKETKAPEGYEIDDEEAHEVALTKDHTSLDPYITGLTFTDHEKTTTATLAVQKQLQNFEDDKTFFVYLLNDSDTNTYPAPMPSAANGTVATVRGGASATFGTITFGYTDLHGNDSIVYEYEIAESIPAKKIPGVRYDTEKHIVKITLAYEDGVLTATPDCGTVADPVISTNVYESGYLKVTKTDATASKNPLANAVFTVYKDASCTVVADTLTTTASGMAQSKELPAGTYWIKETKAPEGYEIDDKEAHEFEVIANATGDTLSFTFTDTEKTVEARIGAKKIVENLPGDTTTYTFVLTAKDGNTLVPADDTLELTAGETGEFGTVTYSYSDIETGKDTQTFTYTVTETVPTPSMQGMTYAAPKDVTVTLHWDSTTDKLTAIVSNDGNNPVEMTNTYKSGKLGVKKQDVVTGEGLEGAEFTVYSDEECTNVVDTISTDSTGFGESKDLPIGIYYVKETKAPEGYNLDDPAKHELEITDKSTGLTLSYTFQNSQKSAKASLDAMKVIDGNLTDTDTGFEFVLTPADDKNPMPATTKVTAKADGISVTFGEMSYTYSMLGNDTSKTFTYWINELEPAAEEKIPGLTYDTTSKTVTVTLTWNKDSDTLTAVPSTLTEPATVTNVYEEAFLKITKTDATESKNPLAGAVFTVYDDKTCTVTAATLTTTADGTAELETGLPVGTYWIKETKAPEGYVIDDSEAHEVALTKDHTSLDPYITGLTFTDHQKTTTATLAVQKQLQDLEDDTTDFIYQLTASASNTYAAPMPDTADGTVATVKAGASATFGTITFGYTDLHGEDSVIYEYEITETIPEKKIPGVRYDTEKHIVKITLTYEDGVLTATPDCGTVADPVLSTNVYESGSLMVIKTDATASKNPLANAVFTVYNDASCTVVADTLTTTASGMAESKELPAGTYWIKETKAPDGYIIDNEDAIEVEVTANATSNTLSFTFTDTEMTTSIEPWIKKTVQNLTGLVVPDECFTFTIEAKTAGAPTPTKTTINLYANELDYFGKLNFRYADLGGENTKDFLYEIKETVPATPTRGIAYDTTPRTVVVTLNYDGATLTATLDKGGKTSPVEFTNSYESGFLKVAKTDEADSSTKLADAEFTIYYDKELTSVADTLTTTFDGTATSKELPAGEYWIKETKAPYGYVPVITDAKSVTLTKEYTSTQPLVLDVTNRIMKTDITFDGTKTLEGRSLTATDIFTFTVTEDGNTVTTGASDANGTITFEKIEYLDETTVGTHTYIVTEDGTGIPGVTPDAASMTVKVLVSQNADGTLKAELLDESDDLDFVNVYEASGSVTFSGEKTLIGRVALTTDVFTFTVTDENGTTVSTGTNDTATGEITFTPIAYTLENVGTHTYTVFEEDPGADWIPDGNSYTVNVTVTDNGDGMLDCVPDGSWNELKFTNTLNVKGKYTPTGSKSLIGRPMIDTDVFTFTVTEDGKSVVATGASDKDGVITFTDIAYDDLEAIGVHTYTVTEDATTVTGVTGDPTEFTFKVKVSNDDGDTNLETELLVSESDEIAFTNIYEAEGKITLIGDKTLTGRDLKESDIFTFTVTEDGKTVTTGASDVSGTIHFKTIVYTEKDVGSHTYTVTEDETTINGVTIDSAKRTVTVMVTDNTDGTLTATIDSASDKLSFVNQYDAEGKLELETVKYVDEEGKAPASGETFTFNCVQEGGPVLTATSDGNGIAAFDPIVYTLADVGTHTYLVYEKDERDNTYVYDPTVYEVTVHVSDAGDGTLNVECGKQIVNADGTRTALDEDAELSFINDRRVSISVTKQWEGGEGGEITLYLYADDTLVPETEVVTDPVTGERYNRVNWKLERDGSLYTFSGLAPRNAERSLITYSVKEKGMTGYMRIYQNVGQYKKQSSAVYDGGTIINRAVTTFRVQKVWSGLSDNSARPKIEFVLYCNGEEYNKKPSGPDKNGWYVWNNLPEYRNGREAIYYVVEKPVPGFTTTYDNPMDPEITDRAYDGATITNTTVPKTGDTAQPMLWMLLALLGTVGACVAVRRRRKN